MVELTDAWPSSYADGPSGMARALAPIPAGDSSAIRSTVRDRIRMAITLQELPAGVRLNQVELAKQLEVSRMPVRDALGDLLAEGLVEPCRGSGVAVRQLTAHDLHSIYAVRTALEVEAVHHLVSSGPGQWHEELDDIITSHRRPLERDDREQLLLLDRRFHWAMYRGTGNIFLSQAMTPLWSHISRAMFALLRLDYSAKAWAEHEQIAEALKSGDRELSESLTRLHLADSLSVLLERLEVTESD